MELPRSAEEQRDRWETDTRELLERVMRAGEVGLWEYDPLSDSAVWNDTLREIAGLDPGRDADFDTWLDLVHPDDRGLARMTEAPDSMDEVRYRIIRPDGEVRHVLVRADRVETSLGRERLVGIVIDISESHRATIQVTSTLEAISDGYFAIDRDWTVVYINRMGEEFLGISKQALVGRNLWEAYPEAVGSTFERYRETMDEGVEIEFEEFYPPLDKWFECRSFPAPYGIAVYFRDVTARHKAEEERNRMLEAERAARELAERAQAKVAHQASHDSLTDLLNRTELIWRLEHALIRGDPMTIVFLDVDRFKLVNDSLGHGVGDELLRTVASRLQTLVSSENPIARFGGDEFVIGLPGWDRDSAHELAERLLDQVRKPMELGETLIYATASVGLARSEGGEGSAADLIRDADVALYRAKESGRDRAVWFDEKIRADLVRRMDLEQRLRDTIDQDGLRLEYQPTFDLRTGLMTDVEALARWDDLKLGPVSPAAFIPVAEESGLIHRIGSWATATTARTAAEWNSSGESARFWVNISPIELARPDSILMFRNHIDESGVDPAHLGIEVTESALAGEEVIQGLSKVADLGVKIAIDDFGTGYSSISRLGELPVDYLKIDRSFVNRVGSPEGDDTLAAIIELAHAIQAQVVAEGVETAEQLQTLTRMRCDYASGFLLARPCRIQSLAEAAKTGSTKLKSETDPRQRR